MAPSTGGAIFRLWEPTVALQMELFPGLRWPPKPPRWTARRELLTACFKCGKPGTMNLEGKIYCDGCGPKLGDEDRFLAELRRGCCGASAG